MAPGEGGPAARLAPLGGETVVAAITPLSTEGGTGGDGSGPASAPGAARLAPEQATGKARLFAPAAPGSILTVDLDKPTDLYRQAVDFVDAFNGGDCFVALPSVDPAGAVDFKVFARDAAKKQAFARAYREALGLDAAIDLGDINAAQCAALSFARGVGHYPDFQLVLDLRAAEVADHHEVAGSIVGWGDRMVHLLLVDDEGVVQSADSLLRSVRERKDFAFQVNLTAGPVATQQLLLAIATPVPLEGLDEHVYTRDAAGFFHALEASVRGARGDVDIAIAGFRVVQDGGAN
jgi:hypothetical protein